MEDTRKYLINLAHGGDGHLSPWIERVTLRRPGSIDAEAFVLHYQAGGGKERELLINNLKTAQSLLLVLENEAKPRDPGISSEEIRQHNAARFAAMQPPEDRGRVIEGN